MKNIRIRAWDKINKIMVYSFGEPIQLPNGEEIIYILTQKDSGEIGVLIEGSDHWCELTNYIGKHDDNHCRIYESDIVKATAVPTWKFDDITKIVKGVDCFGLIDWDENDGMCYINNENYHWPYVQLEYVMEIKVIGNIFENPELIKYLEK